jgi:hypothetical protein
MKSRTFRSLAGAGILLLTMGVAAEAHHLLHRHWKGVINDYTAETGLGGPWQIVGEWSLTAKDDPDHADFSAALGMVRSDLGVIDANLDPDASGSRSAHTHHIALSGATLTHPASGGIRVTGPATITGNGNPAPFGPNSTLTIDITGGTLVPFSNITLTFGGDATKHFGTLPVHGVVRSYREYR